MKEVVIKISDAMYKYITMEHTICIKEVGEYLFGLVRCTGTLLPKGHGKLIDADALRKTISLWGLDDYTPEDFIDEIDNTDAIIEADKEGEQGWKRKST